VDERKPLLRGHQVCAVQRRSGGGGGRWGRGRGLHSFPFQLNLGYSVHRMASLTHECVLKLLKLSSTVNECKPLGRGIHHGIRVRPPATGAVARGGVGGARRVLGRGIHSSTFQLNVSATVGQAVIRGCLGSV